MSAHKIRSVIVTSVWAEDVKSLAAFYKDVLGLQPLQLPDHDHRIHFQLEGGFLVVLRGKPRPALDADPDQFPLFALSVDDLDQAVANLMAHEVPLPWGVQEQDHSRWVMFHDPAGNLIELAEQLTPPR